MTDETLLAGNSGAPESEGGQSQDQIQVDQTKVDQTQVDQTKAESSWIDSLPEDLKGNSSLGKFKDIAALAAGYINAESMIGKDKVTIPSKHATEEDWANFYKKVGMPDPEEFSVEGMDAEKADEFDNKFKELALSKNILPKQASEMYKFFKEHQANSEAASQEAYKNAVNQGIEELKQEWGKAFDDNLTRARVAFETYADEGMINYINETGLGNDPVILKLFSEVGKILSEDKFVGKSMSDAMTPDQAQAKINEIMGNIEHPYHIGEHAGHGDAVKEMEDLYKYLTVTK